MPLLLLRIQACIREMGQGASLPQARRANKKTDTDSKNEFTSGPNLWFIIPEVNSVYYWSGGGLMCLSVCVSVCLSVCVSKKKNADGNVEQLFKFLNSLLNFLKKCLWSTET